jgi:hypothetical protein
VADFEADIPQRSDKVGQGRLCAGREFVRQQDHDIDVGIGVQFAATVTADRYQRGTRRLDIDLPELSELLIDNRGAGMHELDNRFSGLETSLEIFAECRQGRANFPVSYRIIDDRVHQV